jgi:hypothetical protein
MKEIPRIFIALIDMIGKSLVVNFYGDSSERHLRVSMTADLVMTLRKLTKVTAIREHIGKANYLTSEFDLR